MLSNADHLRMRVARHQGWTELQFMHEVVVGMPPNGKKWVATPNWISDWEAARALVDEIKAHPRVISFDADKAARTVVMVIAVEATNKQFTIHNEDTCMLACLAYCLFCAAVSK